MKKIVSTLVILLAFVFSTQAQKRNKKENHEPLSVEQKTNLAVKKMTLALDLTANQQRRIKPLLAQKIEKRQKMREEFKARKKNNQKLSADERYAKMNAKLDSQIAFKAEMKQILNKEQFEKFEKIALKRKHKMKKRMKKHSKKRKHKKEHKE
ncbi:hypothetical protein WH52_12090 [Tenacibaculum holothuriorum]|uniref:DUF4890 domain-containing protein n=1 Tax=Tenacibaculum holothuriorum TaxID=1635173 RepID=A0A1Y2PCH7_9FLAO|nr:hypothetical protein [Tenacibaculum holothuriorum]OSY87378.1 hypothetical protein WH52_12090 [Tenacibaculum holothuriorum]